MTYSVGIYLFDEVEVLDFAGPYEVFSTASRVSSRLYPGNPVPFEVMTLADEKRVVIARGGLQVSPHFSIFDHPPLDVLVIPGGIVTAELQRGEIIAWIREVASTSSIIASVCTGSFLLGQAGLLHGQSATTHWEDIPDLRQMFPDINVKNQARWVDTGQVVTSAGISAGLDMSLYLVSRLAGEDLATHTAKQMEYDWQR